MFRYCAVALSVVCLVIVALNARSQNKLHTQPGKTNVQVLMRDKLTHMKAMLDGMLTEDVEKIAKEAEMLRIIGRAASWQAIDTEEYRTHSSRYARLLSNLTRAAQGKNYDAVLLQYLQLNISCVDCHRYIREQ